MDHMSQFSHFQHSDLTLHDFRTSKIRNQVVVTYERQMAFWGLWRHLKACVKQFIGLINWFLTLNLKPGIYPAVFNTTSSLGYNNDSSYSTEPNLMLVRAKLRYSDTHHTNSAEKIYCCVKQLYYISLQTRWKFVKA